MLRMEIVRDFRRFLDVERAWQELWTRAGGGVFQRFDWISAWWRVAGQPNGFQLNIALAWLETELIAVAPLVIQRYRGIRVLEWAAKDCSDYCDIIFCPGWAKGEVLASVWQHISTSCRFDVAYLSHMQQEANAQMLVHANRRHNVRLRPSHRSAVATGIQLADWASSQAWFHSLGKKGRNNHFRGMRIVGAAGPVTFRLADQTEDIRRSLDRLCTLKQNWLTEHQLSSPVLRGDASLLRELVWTLHRAGRLRLFVLECNGDLVAGSINILEDNRLLAFFAAYDDHYDRASPGTLLMVEYIRWAIDNGLSMVDFLCGDEAYKGRFADTRSQLASLAGARTLLGWLAITVESRVDQVVRHIPGRAWSWRAADHP